MPFEDFINAHGVEYSLRRSCEQQRTEIGLPDSGYIAFNAGTDIISGDVLTNPSGDVYYIVRTETEYFHKVPSCLKAFYHTEQEHNAQNSSGTVFNIQNAYGSVIGNSNQATINYNSAISELKEQIAEKDSADKEELEKIVSLLEMVVNDQVPPSKGLFSRFRDVMERNSWITGSVANAILNWLLTKTL